MYLSTVDNLLHIGIAQAPITPPAGFTISGPEFSDHPSIGTDDDLFVRCITLTSYAETAAFVSLDTWGISVILRNRIAAAVSNALDIPNERVMVTCTGNGTSPPIWRDEDNLPGEYSNYIAFLPDIVAGTALEAAFSVQPAAIGTAETSAPNLSCFADTPQEEQLETEREKLRIAAFHDADGQIICLLYNFACPATVIGNPDRWTSDYPGIASAALEQAGIECAAFVQGASEDVRPYDWWDGNTDISHAERTSTDAQALGLLLATQAIRAAPSIVSRRNAPVKAATSDDGTASALRVGDTVIVSTNQSRLVQFAVDLREALPDVKLLIATNYVTSTCADTDDPFDEVIGLVKRTIA
ncbi:MAG: hypothetical protein F4X40_07485 [Chloroflexi bacterium]|nr:hypothetical protein [Chloroflexota bacterium]